MAPLKVVICQKSLKIWPKSMNLNLFAKYQKIWAKMAPSVVWLRKIGAQRCLVLKNWRPMCADSHETFWIFGNHPKRRCLWSVWEETFAQSVAWKLRKFGQKSFAPPKICLFLHLWLGHLTLETFHWFCFCMLANLHAHNKHLFSVKFSSREHWYRLPYWWYPYRLPLCPRYHLRSNFQILPKKVDAKCPHGIERVHTVITARSHAAHE